MAARVVEASRWQNVVPTGIPDCRASTNASASTSSCIRPHGQERDCQAFSAAFTGDLHISSSSIKSLFLGRPLRNPSKRTSRRLHLRHAAPFFALFEAGEPGLAEAVEDLKRALPSGDRLTELSTAVGRSLAGLGEEQRENVGAALSLISQSASDSSSELSSIVTRSVQGIQGLGVEVLSQSTAVSLHFSESPSLSRLSHSAAMAAKSAEHLGIALSSKVGHLASSVGDDPIAAALTAQHAAMEAVLGLATDSAVAVYSQPGALLAVAAIVGALLGRSLGQVLATINSPGYMSRGSHLPLKYNPEAIAGYFYRRPLEVLFRSAKIMADCSALVSSILLDRVAGKEAENERMRARQLVDLITCLGPTAIKIGQAISIRPDLLSLVYLEELQSLQDRVPPFSSDEARTIIQEGLGQAAETVFSEISAEPVAAASLGQVYRAVLRETGEEVAVKVQRPAVLESISRDLFVMRHVARLLQKLPNVHTDLVDVLDTWAARFFDELDYVQESMNQMRFAEEMKALKNVMVPQVYPKYTSQKVLTTSWVVGEKLSEARTPDLPMLVTTALNCYLIQLLETGFLHADPHPGNLLRTPGGKLCILDFGLMTEVSEEQRYALIAYISHLVNSDFDRVAEDLVDLGFVPPELVDPEKTAAVVPQLSRVLGELVRGGGAKGINVQQVTDDLAKMAEEYVFVIPPYFALILRAFGVLEGIGLDNDPSYAIVNECYPYISKRLLTDDSPRARAALRYFLYGKEDRLDVQRVENVAAGFQTFRTLMAPTGSSGTANNAPAAPPQPRRAGIDPAAKQALALVFAPEGSYMQELLLTELVRSVDALSREALAELWAFFSDRVLFPLPSSMLAPNSYPLPLPGVMFGLLVTGEWRSARLSSEDQQALSTVRRIWALVEGQLASRDDTPGVAELARDLIPLVREVLPGITTAAQRFVLMLIQRQALRLADDLDGRNSVAEWDKDPAAFARLIQPARIFRRALGQPLQEVNAVVS